MKTAKEILKKVEQENGGDLWFAEGEWEIIEKAMKAYAEQAIERCAEQAETKDIHEGKPYMSHMVVDRESILRIKSELK